MDFVIFADDDTDGLCSTKLMRYNYLKNLNHTAIIFQKWNIFGMRQENVDNIIKLEPLSVDILDIGSDATQLKFVEQLLEQNITVHMIDNHPPDPDVLSKNEMDKFNQYLSTLKNKYENAFYYNSSNESCTTALVYEYNSYKTKVLMPPVARKWALIGIEGDVATNKKQSGPLFSKLLSEEPFFGGSFIFQNKAGNTFNWGLLSYFAQFFHIPRRIIFDDAPKLCLDAMDEMDTLDDWFAIYDVSRRLTTKNIPQQHIDYIKSNYPNIYKLIDLHNQWSTWKSALTQLTSIDYQKATISYLSYPWNIGSAVANLKSSELNKPQFVINDIPQKGIYISGRAKTEHNIHIGKVFKMCNPNLLEGGGIKEAGTAIAKTTSIEEIINELATALTKL